LFSVGGYKLSATAKEVIDAGFTAAFKDTIYEKEYKSDKEDSQEITGFDSAHCKITGAKIIDKKTTPPKEYAIDTLLAFMENPKGDAETGKLACLGTPATRADIIKKLLESPGNSEPYIIEKGKKLYAGERCKFLLSFLQADPELKKITDVDNTTEWEKQLAESPAEFEKTIAE
jgi:DNA topoisomerase IA